MVKCNYCSMTIKGGIFIFKRHLTDNRDDVGSCSSVSDDVRYLFMEIVVKSDQLSFKKRQLMDIEKDVCEVETQKMEIVISQKKGKVVVGSSIRVQNTINQMVEKN